MHVNIPRPMLPVSYWPPRLLYRYVTVLELCPFSDPSFSDRVYSSSSSSRSHDRRASIVFACGKSPRNVEPLLYEEFVIFLRIIRIACNNFRFDNACESPCLVRYYKEIHNDAFTGRFYLLTLILNSFCFRISMFNLGPILSTVVPIL